MAAAVCLAAEALEVGGYLACLWAVATGAEEVVAGAVVSEEVVAVALEDSAVEAAVVAEPVVVGEKNPEGI